MLLNKTKYKASTTTVIIRLLTVWLSLSDYTESACIIINRDYIRPCIFHSPSRSMETLHLLHGCNGRSACEDHSNMLACSVARCWGGQSRAPAGNQERGETGEFPQGGHVPRQNVTVSLKPHYFLLPTCITPVSTLPFDLSPQGLQYLLKFLYTLITPFSVVLL